MGPIGVVFMHSSSMLIYFGIPATLVDNSVTQRGGFWLGCRSTTRLARFTSEGSGCIAGAIAFCGMFGGLMLGVELGECTSCTGVHEIHSPSPDGGSGWLLKDMLSTTRLVVWLAQRGLAAQVVRLQWKKDFELHVHKCRKFCVK